VPQHLFQDADEWLKEAKEKLDLFNEFADTPNFINYDMLENKDASRPDMISIGEQVVDGLETHKDVVFSKVQDQVNQLALRFDDKLPVLLNKAVECLCVDGVNVDAEEINALTDKIKKKSKQSLS
jgi:hypothetical protein